MEEASNAMAFDGLMCCGETLKMRRPHDYNLRHARQLGPTEPAAGLDLNLLGARAASRARRRRRRRSPLSLARSLARRPPSACGRPVATTHVPGLTNPLCVSPNPKP